MNTFKKLLFLLSAAILLGLFAPQLISAQQTVACEKDYIVEPGDWLSTIAQAEYGDKSLYPALAVATNAQAAADSSYAKIQDPAVIVSGWKICVPSKTDAEALMTVVKAASTPTTAAAGATAQPTAAPTKEANVATSNTVRLRELDFAPFKDALATFTPERAGAVAAIVKDADISQVQDAVQAGKLTYAELTLYFLSNIQKQDETLRTMVELNPDALKEAQAADQLLKDGKAASLMLGIPVTLKDNIETAAPMHTTGGAEILLNNQPKADASFVKQLRDAGAVILGKANLSELAGGIAITPPGASAVGGQTVNPHGNFSPGGSSSGSGAGTAAYETMVSVGSETSGSLIVPATWNGVVGMYPGRDVVDSTNVIPLIHNNDSAGPIGRNVKDVAALLGVIDTTDTDYVAGLDPKALDSVNAGLLKADILANKGNALENTADNATVVQLIEKGLTAAGAKVTDAELQPAGITGQLEGGLTALIGGGVRHDMVPYIVSAGAPIKTLEDLAAYNAEEPKTRIPFGQGTVEMALGMAALKDPAAYQGIVSEIKPAAIAALDAAFAESKADVLVSVSNYHSAPYAIANYPAITVPLGLRANGMPIGVTFIGKPGSEAKLLAYAYAFEQATKLRVAPDLSKLNTPASTSSGSTTASKFGKAWTPISCETLEIAPAIAAQADCGYVTVPEKRGESGLALGDKTIQLGVVRLKSPSPNPGAPIFQGEGGPGGYGLLFVGAAAGAAGIDMSKINQAILADHDWVYFTQRGTKGAKPFLSCPEYDAIDYNAALNGWTQAEKQAQIVKTLTTCRDNYVAQGVDLTAYNTNENAADINDIRQALGYDKINYYGISYGTWLGQFLMRNHPEMLNAVILDGVAPVEFTAYSQITNPTKAFNRMFDACKADADCNAAYPDLENTLAQVVQEVDANPKEIEVKDAAGKTVTLKINGTTLMNALWGELTGGSAQLPYHIYQLKAGDAATWAKYAPSAHSESGRIMHFSINCSDDPNASLDEFKLGDMAPMYAHFMGDDGMRLVEACKIVQVPQLPAVSDEPVSSDLPVLVFNGGIDPATDPAYGAMVAAHLPNSQNILFPTAGHGQAQNPCAMSLLGAFVNDPSAKVDTKCIPPKLNFFEPHAVNVSTEDGKATLTTTLPTGFDPGKQPNTWFMNFGLQTIAFAAYPAGTSGEDALNAYIKNMPFKFEVGKIEDGEPIDGNPTKIMHTVVDFSGTKIGVDMYAIQAPSGTFVMAWVNQDARTFEPFKPALDVILQGIKVNSK